MSTSAVRERLAAAWRAAADAPVVRAARTRPIAIGWATVELDRATVELAYALGLSGGEDAFRSASRSAALGCACRVAAGALPNGGSLVALEPDTEGRLAGTLARRGEGPSVAWLAPEQPAAALEALRAAGFTLRAEQDGPFGPERLIVGGATNGSHQLLVGRAAGTIRS
jgi:hypothetical protein